MTSPATARQWWQTPTFVVGLYTAILQWVTLRPLLGPFIYADELGYVAAARYFGPGYPDVQMQAGFLHTGYGLLLSPLTVIFDEPQAFHRAATSLNGALLVLAAVLTTRLLAGLFALGTGAAVLVGALFASSTAVMVTSGLVWTESLLIVMFVIFAWLVVDELTAWRMWALVGLAVLFYLVHPRAIVFSFVVLLGLAIDGRRRDRLGLVAAAVVVLATGIVAVRLFHDHVAGQLYARNAIELGSNTSVTLRLRNLLERPSNWIGSFIGTAWYQVAATFGLGLVAITAWIGAGARWVRGTDAGGSSDQHRVGFFLGAATISGWLVAATISGGEAVRVDHAVYGRYLDHLGPFAMAFGAAMVLSKAPGWKGVPWIGAAVAPLVLGGAATLWWGTETFEVGRPYAPINAPFFASMADLVESRLPVVIGAAATAVALGAAVIATRWPALVLVCLMPVLVGIGLHTSSQHVERHSRDTVNLRAMADAVEASGAQQALLAEPFAFLNLYGGQFWADDVQFVLGSECPATTAYDVVIAPIDDVRYLDHRVVFTDPRSERQLLEPPAVTPADASDVAVRFVGFPSQAVSGSAMQAEIEIENTGSDVASISSGGARPALVAYRFVDPDQSSYNTPPVIVDTGAITLQTGETATLTIDLDVGFEGQPLDEGRYELIGDLFIGGLGWVNEAGCPGGLPDGITVEVVDE